MNNNINAILEAAGELDNDVLENAFKPRKKKPIALVVIAAAAVVLSLLVGFTAAYRYNVSVNGKPVFDYNITIHDEVTPLSFEELTEMGVSELYQHQEKGILEGIYEYAMEDIDPRDLIQKYNITLLGNNNNFSRADNKGYSTTRVRALENYHENGIYGSYVTFIYWLADDRLDIPVSFRAICLTEEFNADFAADFRSIKPDGSDIAYIDLNNNEMALIHQRNSDDVKSYASFDVRSLATFTYDGIIYYISADTDIEGMKQIFSDLGIV